MQRREEDSKVSNWMTISEEGGELCYPCYVSIGAYSKYPLGRHCRELEVQEVLPRAEEKNAKASRKKLSVDRL